VDTILRIKRLVDEEGVQLQGVRLLLAAEETGEAVFEREPAFPPRG
jgi:hypothetical protein